MSEQTDTVAPDESVAPATPEDEAVAEVDALRAQLAAATALRNANLQPAADAPVSDARQAELDAEKANLQAQIDDVLAMTAKESGQSVEDVNAAMVAAVEEQKAAADAQAEALANAEPVDPAADAPAPSEGDVNSVPPSPGDQTPVVDPPAPQTPDAPVVPEVPDTGEAVPAEAVADAPKTSRKAGNN